jgi:hypothetical protein
MDFLSDLYHNPDRFRWVIPSKDALTEQAIITARSGFHLFARKILQDGRQKELHDLSES